MTQFVPSEPLPPSRAASGLAFDLSFLPDGYEGPVRRFARVSLALCLVIITVGSLVPPSLADLAAAGINDKTAHLAGYAGTMLCAAFAVSRRRARWAWGLFLLGYGALMEWGQAAMALGRDASLADMAANGAGVFTGAVCAVLIVRLGHSAARRGAKDGSRL